jgi:hypothetical protein
VSYYVVFSCTAHAKIRSIIPVFPNNVFVTHTLTHLIATDYAIKKYCRINTATTIIDIMTIKLSATFDWALRTFFEDVFVFCQSEPHTLRSQFFS